MTQIRGHMPATRRPGKIGVHSLDHFGFAVPDIAQAQDFYISFGLDCRVNSNRLELYTFGSPHRWINITEGSSKRLGYLSFGVFEEDFGRFRLLLKECNIEFERSPLESDNNSVWFRDNNGILIEVKVADKSSPNDKSTFAATPSSPAGERGATTRRKIQSIQPRRLAHVVVFVRDVAASINFYTNTLGLKLSDQAGEVAFMHAIHGSDHHLIALVQSSSVGFHHCSWDVPSIEEIGLGAMQMANRGYVRGWGLGRHVLGSNYFHYVRDPWGSYCEYSADMDYIPVTMDWEGQTHVPEDAFYLWGPSPPPDFVTNYE